MFSRLSAWCALPGGGKNPIVVAFWLLNAQHMKAVPGRKTDVMEPAAPPRHSRINRLECRTNGVDHILSRLIRTGACWTPKA
jgi:hypothetical protein